MYESKNLHSPDQKNFGQGELEVVTEAGTGRATSGVLFLLVSITVAENYHTIVV